MNKYSITSNDVKLYKHLDKLKSIQDHKPRPIMLHFSPTNKCNRKCVHCCFEHREKNISLPWDISKRAIKDFYDLGITGLEFTGGGEPTFYENVNDAIDYCSELGLSVGMNTNALSIDKVDDWSKLSWVRVALNIIDDDGVDDILPKFMDAVSELKKHTSVTACYIAPKEIGDRNVGKVVELANKLEIPSRIAPDCIQTRDDIRSMIDILTEKVAEYANNEYCFCSDFNVYLFERPHDTCMIHMIKPFLYTDGWIYACPSSELAIENGRTMNPRFRICRVEDVSEYYHNNFDVKSFDCSYCKYALQNNILRALIEETDNNDFA